MLNLKSISDSALLEKTRSLAFEERRITTEVLWHLHEIEARRLYAEHGYSSLFDYAVRALGYSEGAAGRRVAAMRLLAEVPEIESKLTDGKLSLSTLSTVHYCLKNMAASGEEKRDLLQSLEGKSRRECEQVLAKVAPQAVREERERQITPELTEIRFNADAALMEKLKKLRELDSHVNSDPSYLDLFHRLADLALKRLDPEQKKTKPTPPAKSESRYVPSSIKKAVWARDEGKCTYVPPDGTKCGSTHALQYDHIIPVALGGPSTVENLRLRCRTHNLYEAIETFGRPLMSKYLNGQPKDPTIP